MSQPDRVQSVAGISAILTAAGESTRMGQPKALLPWGSTTLVEYQIACLAGSGVSDVLVVLGHQADEVTPRVRTTQARFVLNPLYKLGKTTSIKAGLREIDAGADAILLLAVDQPRTTEIISTVIRAHFERGALITSPRFHGRGGHPLIFSASLREELQKISEEREGIREVFRAHRHEVTEVELDDPIVTLDLNTREDYEQAQELFGA